MVMRYSNRGFTLIEMMIAVAVVGILAAIAYPSYQSYIIKTKRTTMMTELQSIANQLTAKKMAKGSFTNIATDKTDLEGDYPRDGGKLYSVAINLDDNNDKTLGDWKITASPKSASPMSGDGDLTLDASGIKCRIIGATKKCGKEEEWLR